MKKITKDNIHEFMEHYHFLHDSFINKLDLNTNDSKIEMIISIYWSGEPTIKEDGTYDTHKKKIRLVLSGINDFKDCEDLSCIDDTYIECCQKNGKDLICISIFSPEHDNVQYLYIECENIEYEILSI